MIKRFYDRIQAGRLLAQKLKPNYADLPDVSILALPRGGVPVGYEIAEVLHASLDVCIVRKLGVPGHQELAMGAIGFGVTRVINEDLVWSLKNFPIRHCPHYRKRKKRIRTTRSPLSWFSSRFLCKRSHYYRS